MTISQEAIEAAARATYVTSPNRWHQWEHAPEGIKETYRAHAKTALDAAMPAIREQLAQEIEAGAKERYGDNQMYSVFFEGEQDAMKYAARIVKGKQ